MSISQWNVTCSTCRRRVSLGESGGMLPRMHMHKLTPPTIINSYTEIIPTTVSHPVSGPQGDEGGEVGQPLGYGHKCNYWHCAKHKIPHSSLVSERR